LLPVAPGRGLEAGIAVVLVVGTWATVPKILLFCGLQTRRFLIKNLFICYEFPLLTVEAIFLSLIGLLDNASFTCFTRLTHAFKGLGEGYLAEKGTKRKKYGVGVGG
jgi:hypothetical protein